MADEVWIPTPQVRAGDTLHRWRTKGSPYSYALSRGPGLVSRVIQAGQAGDMYTATNQTLHIGSRSDLEWLVTRITVTKSPSGQVAYHNDTRWNGTCKCGANTYTSCFFVDHDGPCRLEVKS